MQLTEKLGYSWDIILWNLRLIVHLRMLSMDFAHEFSSPTPFPDEQLFELTFWNSGKVKEAEWGLFPERGTGDTKASSRCPRGPGSVSGLDRNILGHQRFFFFVLFFRATPLACGSSQVRGQIGATAASLHHRHCSMWSQPRLGPTPQLIATTHP